MALPATRPGLTREELIAAKIEELRLESLRLQEIYPDPWKTLGEVARQMFGDDPGVLSFEVDECYFGRCDEHDDAG